jgi:hypothetical protein
MISARIGSGENETNSRTKKRIIKIEKEFQAEGIL